MWLNSNDIAAAATAGEKPGKVPIMKFKGRSRVRAGSEVDRTVYYQVSSVLFLMAPLGLSLARLTRSTCFSGSASHSLAISKDSGIFHVDVFILFNAHQQ